MRIKLIDLLKEAEEEKKTESCSKLQYAWKSVVDVVLWDKPICIGEEINNSQKNQIKKQLRFY
jgi:hypothetical protein